MDDLRRAVARVLALTPAVRLVAIEAGDVVASDGLAVYAAVGGAGPRRIAADPLRLPFVAALADRALVKIWHDDEPPGRLREIWRILAPAGVLVVVSPLPTSDSLNSLIRQRLIRRRVARRLVAAMFEPASVETVPGWLIIGATKRDGLAPQRGRAAAVQTTDVVPAARPSTNTA